MTLAEQLRAAKQAYHDLMTGKSARVIVDSDGSRVEYTSANADRLRAYIAELEAQLAGNTSGRRRPLTPFF
jgi:hypothetical protein